MTHPAFVRAAAITGPFAGHFPTSAEAAQTWTPFVLRRALSMRVLAVARTRVECAWAAYIDAVCGLNHQDEQEAVLDHGDKLPENVARALFPLFDEVRYAK